MRRSNLLLTLSVLGIIVGGTIWAETLTAPKPQNRTVKLRWNQPNATIRNGTLVYDSMTGIWAQQMYTSNMTPLVRVYTINEPKNYTEQKIGNATVIQRLANITKTNLTRWPIWNRTTDRIEYLLTDQDIYSAVWTGGTIITNTSNTDYRGTLEELERFHRDAFSYLPEPEIEMTPVPRKPYQLIPATILITAGLIGLISVRR